MTTTLQAFDELWWFYLCRVQEKHRTFDKMLAFNKPATAFEQLERELLVHHPVYHRSIWFLAAVNVLMEAGESIDLRDRRILSVVQFVRELSRESGNTKTWRNALTNGVARMKSGGESYSERDTRVLIRMFVQYISLTEEFQGSLEGRTFFLWASKRLAKTNLKVTTSGHRIYLPSQYELESQSAIGLSLIVGSKHYLDLLENAQDILLRAKGIGAEGFWSAMWALQADSLFDRSKVSMAYALRHSKQAFLDDGNAAANLAHLRQGGPPLESEEALKYEEMLSRQEEHARSVSAEDTWSGRLVREYLFGRALEETYAVEYA